MQHNEGTKKVFSICYLLPLTEAAMSECLSGISTTMCTALAYLFSLNLILRRGTFSPLFKIYHSLPTIKHQHIEKQPLRQHYVIKQRQKLIDIRGHRVI